MKKAIAILLPLTLLVSAVSCSQGNKSESSPASGSGSASQSESEDNYVDPASSDTNFTKGSFKDGLYVNEYANLRMKVPDTLYSYSSSILAEDKEKFLAGLTEEADITREKARIWDAQFASPQENVSISFINTKLAFPDSSDVSAEDVLDVYKDFIDKTVIASGGDVKWIEKEKTTLGKEEFTRNVAYYGGDETNYEAIYTRKLDDSLVCWIHFASNDPDRPASYYEKLFAE